MKKGKLIVFEGACDGIGKTTQYELFKKRLEKEGKKIKSHHFPSYGTSEASAVEMYLKGEFGHPSEISPYFINSIYAHDRAVTWYTKLKESYDNGEVILLDRYTTSSLIYQSALIEDENEKKKFIDYVVDFEYNKIGIKKPDKVIFLWAPFELVNELRNKREQNDGIINDIHERDLEFMKKVYDSAMFIANYLSWNKIQCNCGNEIRSIEDIHEEIYKLLEEEN